MQANHRHYILFILAFGAIAIAVLGYVSLYRAVRAQSIQAHQSMKELSVSDEKKQQEEDTVSIFKKTADVRARLHSAILTQDKIVDFIKNLEQVGTDTGSELELSAISDETIAGDTVFSYFRGHVDVSGTWTDCIKALSLIEHMPYAISLNNVRLAPSTDSQIKISKPGKVWKLSLDIKVLSKK